MNFKAYKGKNKVLKKCAGEHQDQRTGYIIN